MNVSSVKIVLKWIEEKCPLEWRDRQHCPREAAVDALHVECFRS